MDPTKICGGVQVNMTATRTFLLAFSKRCFWSQQNAHLEFHSTLNSACELRRTNDLAIISSYHFIIAPLDKINANAIFAMGLDNMVKILEGGDS
jgi:hypothetical protein